MSPEKAVTVVIISFFALMCIWLGYKVATDKTPLFDEEAWDKNQVALCLSRNGIAKLNRRNHYEGCEIWPLKKQ